MATDDYMSDEFLKLAQEIEEKGKSSSSRSLRKRSKPSPFPSSSTSTGDSSLTLSSLSSQPLSKKKVQELMEERTIEGMETAIQSTNKGFKLLQKFGYTEGKGGLGKNNSGIENPLKIVKRENNDRSGIGVENDNLKLKKKFQDKVDEFIRQSDLEAGFLAAIKHKKRCQQMTFDIRNCENAIENLDTRSLVGRHNLWPPTEDLEVEDETFEVADIRTKQESYLEAVRRLEFCIQYLRSSYRYCVYCGTSFESWEDMEGNCPGPLKEDHE